MTEFSITNKYQPHLAFKPSGVEWLEKIPEHRDNQRFKLPVNGCFNDIWWNE